MSERVGFRMQLAPGARDTYKARHDAIWPELRELLTRCGISEYSIFLHEPTGSLFAVLTRADDHTADRLGEHEIMRRWWAAMADIMMTDASGEPVVEHLPLMFHLD